MWITWINRQLTRQFGWFARWFRMDHAWIRVDHAWIGVGCRRFDPEPAVPSWQVVRTNDPKLRHHRSQIPTEGLRRSEVVAVVLSPRLPLGVQFLGLDVVLPTSLAALPDESRDG